MHTAENFPEGFSAHRFYGKIYSEATNLAAKYK